MSLSRREFLQMLATASAAGMGLGCNDGASASRNVAGGSLYEVPAFGNVSLLHYTDCHAQLLPIYFREPSVNLGLSGARGKAPHLVGESLLKHFNIAPGSVEAHAFTYLDFNAAAKKYGKVGGFAHLATLVKSLREQRKGRSLLLDGGDTWQGSATALWTNGQDMVDAQKLLGVDMMTAHWEFTYGAERVKEIVDKQFKGKVEFLAQNVFDTSFGDELVFSPYAMRTLNGVQVAIIGQAFPYTAISNPRWMFPAWSFQIREEEMQKTVNEVRGKGAQVVVVLSHNGMDVDLKMASRVTGIDVIMGGHTHDAVPAPSIIPNGSGKTLVINSGSNTKFLSVLDLDVKNGKVADFRYKLLPIFSNLIEPDAKMAAYIEKMRDQSVTYKGQTFNMKQKLSEKLAVTETTLYRRGNFSGTFDQLICDAMVDVQGADMAFSPGFRWGTSLLPGDAITMEHLMDQTAITYPSATLNNLSGEQIKEIMEDVADNLYHEDPYYQQGGDMVRVGGMAYTMDLTQKHGKRIQDMEIRGKKVDARKTYKVAGWASIQENPAGSRPIWEVVSEWLLFKQTIRIDKPYLPKLVGAEKNPGIGT